VRGPGRGGGHGHVRRRRHPSTGALIPDDFEIVETSPGRAQLIVAVIDYRDNDLGDDDEVG
jgi:hypothetical protein